MLMKASLFKKFVHDCVFRQIHGNKLIYNTCWEDATLDRQMMQLNQESRVVMITSAGCNALNYLLDGPKEIHCVDINFRQNALLQLKMAAIRELDYEDYFQLFGQGKHDRYAAVFDVLKRQMPEYARHYWARHMEYFSDKGLRKSFFYHGAAGNVALMIRHYLNSRKELRDRVYDLLDCNSLEEQWQLYSHIEPDFWNFFTSQLIANPVVLSMLGVPRAQAQLIKESYPGGIAAYIKDKLRHVFTRLPIKDNYFWRVYIRGEYTRLCCPEYLKEANQPILRERLSRIYAYNQSVADFLRNNPGDYTHFVLLDHQDWLAANDPAALEEEWMYIVYNSAERAKVLMRSASAAIDFIPASVRSSLLEKPELSADMHRRDRVGTYGDLMFAEVK